MHTLVQTFANAAGSKIEVPALGPPSHPPDHKLASEIMKLVEGHVKTAIKREENHSDYLRKQLRKAEDDNKAYRALNAKLSSEKSVVKWELSKLTKGDD